MAVIEAAHLGAIPHGQEERYRSLYIVGGEVVVNRVGSDQEVELFRNGIREFDVLVGSRTGALHRLVSYDEDAYRVRTIGHKEGLWFKALSVLEPLPEHPIYDPEAEAQFFFEAHHFVPGIALEIEAGHVLEPKQELVRPFVALGRLAAVSAV